MLVFIALFLPLFSFFCLIFFGGKLPRQGDWLAIGAVLVSLWCSIMLFADIFPAQVLHYQINWFAVYTHEFKLGLLVDKYSVVMLVLVELPPHPLGSVHVYEEAPGTDAMLYVCATPLHTSIAPRIGPG